MSTWSFGHPPPNDLIYCWAFWVQLGSKKFWVGVGGYDLGGGCVRFGCPKICRTN